jgi:hypothetical protein
MLSKRDKLIVKIASRLNMFQDAMLGPIASAKQKDPNKALDRVMRDLGLITRDQQKQLARAFNDYIQKKRKKSGRQKSPPASALTSSPTDGENTYILPENRRVQEAPIMASAGENTYVLDENRPVTPPSSEMTLVLGNEDAIRRAAPLEAENTFVLPENQSQAPSLEPVTEFEQTFVMRDKHAAPAKPKWGQPATPPPSPKPVTEFEPTFVLKDEGAKPVTEFEPTFVLRDEAPQKAPAPSGWGAPAAPPPQEDVTEFEQTLVLNDEKPAPEVTEFEPTFVLQDEDAEVRRLPDMVLDMGAAEPLDLVEDLTLLPDDHEEQKRSAPAPFPMGPAVAPNPFAQSPDSGIAPSGIETENTFVLQENSNPTDQIELAGMGSPSANSSFSSFNSGQELSLKDDSEIVDHAPLPRPDESSMDLSIPDDLDLDIAPPSSPTIPVIQAKTESDAEISIANLSLKSENTGSSSGAPTPGATKSGGPLNREVFKRLANQRRSFKGYSIGDYEIQSEISRGAMGVVLRATPKGMAKTMAQARGFDGDVALKVMLENNVDPKEAERFLEEMKILTKLNHPNIVRIFDCGREGGLSYFSMELLEGRDVRNMVTKGGAIPFMLTIKIISQIASALAFLHRSTVYHRDLKPTNVIFDQSVQPYRAVLIDFGLVINHGSEKDKGLILGTPQYMPPEQAQPRGGFGPVNATSDIYSLGATFYFMLTGRPPFIGRDPRKIIKRVVTEAVRDPVELNNEIPRRLADICLKCLEKNQRDRYTAARLLAADLEKELKASQRMLKAKSFLNRFWKPKA